MSDPYGRRDDWTRPAGQPDDSARPAAWESDNRNVPREQTADAWADVPSWQYTPNAEPRMSLHRSAWTLSMLIPIMAVIELSYAWDFFTRTPQTLDQGSSYVGFNIGYFYPVLEGGRHAVGFLIFVVTVAMFITWQYKHAKNAQLLGQHRGLGPGWAIGGWFIPLANLILPAVQLVQSSRASDPPPNRYGDVKSRTALVVWWAVLFDLSLFELSFLSPDPDTAQTSDTLNGLLAILSVPAAVLAVTMIWQLTKRQETALDARGL